MANEISTASTASPSLPVVQVYGMAVICLAAGLAIGYLFLGSQSHAILTQPVATAAPSSPHVGAMGSGHMPGLEAMKQMADKQAEPVLEKLKSDPNNGALLVQAGGIYHTSHQFKEAAVFYGKAMQADPRNVAVRTKLAASLYRAGDVDGAIAQLNQALKIDPKDANSLFDIGMIKLQGKQDGKGALAAWQQLLKSNPQLSADRKATVQKLMANVLTTMGEQRRIEGAESNGGHK
jgi:cytochrome c-type biogenesis protein CcmH/NrfG